jgi:hypothetical protein
MTSRQHKFVKELITPDGAKVTVTICSEEPINQEDFFITRDDAMTSLAQTLANLGEALKPEEK